MSAILKLRVMLSPQTCNLADRLPSKNQAVDGTQDQFRDKRNELVARANLAGSTCSALGSHLSRMRAKVKM